MKTSICLAVMATLLLAACSSITTITSPHPGTTVAVREKHLTLPASEKLKGTSFGNYEFKAIETGFEPFYGILPLSFKGGHLAVDIIFFAPAAFFNLREVFPFYQIDVEKNVIRYRKTEQDEWQEYHPKAEESARARVYFNEKNATVESR